MYMKAKKNTIMKPLTKESLTPSELIHKKMDDPDYAITDDDIKNMKVGVDAIETLEEQEDEKAGEIKKNKASPDPLSVLEEE